VKKIVLAAALSLFLAGCGYDGHYRYECQDPANWNDSDCHPPTCLVDGMCTENLIGFDPTETTLDIPISDDTPTTGTTEETTIP
jgi:hypothetical protein